MDGSRPLNIPVILGTSRKGRASAHAARWITGHIAARDSVTTRLIDVAELALPIDDAGEAIKQGPISEALIQADALVIVSPRNGYVASRSGSQNPTSTAIVRGFPRAR